MKGVLFVISILVPIFLIFKDDNNAALPKFSYSSSVVGQRIVDPLNGQYKRNWQLTISAIPSEGWIFYSVGNLCKGLFC